MLQVSSGEIATDGLLEKVNVNDRCAGQGSLESDTQTGRYGQVAEHASVSAVRGDRTIDDASRTSATVPDWSN